MALALAILALPSLVACEGADGDACQLAADCNSGLVCCKVTPSLAERGVCRAADMCMAAPVPDSGPPPADTGLRDAAADANSSDDASPSDAGADGAEPPADTGLPDTAVSDVGLPDTGAPDTGAPDTGVPAEDAATEADTGVVDPDSGVT